MSAEFSVEIEDKGFSEALAAAAGLGVESLRPELGRLGESLIEFEIKHEFAAGVNPYGAAWELLRPYTIERKKQEHSAHPFDVLKDTGELANSFHSEVIPEGVSIYTDRVFADGTTAAIHQEGGTHPRTLHFLPPREMLPFEGLPIDWLQLVELFVDAGVNRVFR